MSDRDDFEAAIRKVYGRGMPDAEQMDLLWQGWQAALASERAKRAEPSDDLVAKLRSLASELDADDSPEQIHPGVAICSQAADMLEAFRLQRDLDGPAWERHVERMRLAEDEVQRLKAAPPAVQSEPVASSFITDSKCSYLMAAGQVCNKCGRIHSGAPFPAVQAEPVALDRWGIKSVPGRPEDYWFEKMPDGYWTPWHLANEALQLAAPPADQEKRDRVK